MADSIGGGVKCWRIGSVTNSTGGRFPEGSRWIIGRATHQPALTPHTCAPRHINRTSCEAWGLPRETPGKPRANVAICLRQKTRDASRRGGFAGPVDAQTTDGIIRHIRSVLYSGYVALSRARTAEGLRLVGSPEGFRARCQVDAKIGGWL